MISKQNEDQNFWHIRSDYYDKLFWTRDKGYLDAIIECSDLKKGHLVLDVGTGTGAISNSIKNHVRHVVAVDISDSMLSKGKWSGVSVIKWDIGNSLFHQNLFDRVIARMVFHHILNNLDRALLRCYDLLKENGLLVIAEGIPPSDDEEVIEWYTEMFKHKEERRTFTTTILTNYLEKNGFKDIIANIHIMENFSVNNWLENSGLPKTKQKIIYQMHINSSKKIKEVYQMRIEKGECFIRTTNLIVSGRKELS